MYTEGKIRAYERQMQAPRHGKPRGGGKRRSRFQYSYADLSCDFCLHRKQCPFVCCPHIMGNLAELMCDAAFTSAIESAESCKNGHKRTLLHLKSRRIMMVLAR